MDGVLQDVISLKIKNFWVLTMKKNVKEGHGLVSMKVLKFFRFLVKVTFHLPHYVVVKFYIEKDSVLTPFQNCILRFQFATLF